MKSQTVRPIISYWYLVVKMRLVDEKGVSYS